MMKFVKCALAAGMATAVMQMAPPANAADLVQKAPAYAYERPGPCGEAGVLSSVVRTFRYQVTHVPYLPDVGIVAIRSVRENRYYPAVPDHPIARRYCEAEAYLSNGRRYPVWYRISTGLGFAGIGDKIEECIIPFDRWHVYDGHCRVLQ